MRSETGSVCVVHVTYALCTRRRQETCDKKNVSIRPGQYVERHYDFGLLEPLLVSSKLMQSSGDVAWTDNGTNDAVSSSDGPHLSRSP